MKKTQNAWKVIAYVVLTVYALVTLIPFIWAMSASFKTLEEIVSGTMNFIPKDFTFENYKQIFIEQKLFPRWLFNSLFIAIVGTALNLLFNSMAGYALARLSFPGKKSIFMMILAVLMIPGQVTMIPNFLILKELGWLNTYQGMIVPAMVNATFIFMMRQFFINFPKELEEAAELDGLSKFGTFFKVVLPLAKPALAAQAIFVFMGFWNDFMRPLIVMSDTEMFTLTLGLNTFKGQYISYWNYIMAASMVFTLPMLLLYAFFNKYFVKGISFTGGK
ncbi:carbohydrate ABC transporter permease [Priestia flexa]|jgi:multiple sugar transport system permease protein|uniref:Carbohydrate ABC transporter permease n=1 Tax=Priestia flexa TaxID=86664 RepID=A0A8I1MEL6_9BACI|nr:carbohydrate ABC transporter permease [Priestia flexa]MBN8251760.1 carbohydrate ABC transporter permease [Priestia flexa]MBN8434823.1 carbohydrate ABC transporter permease [Priestia flexa]MCA0967601.1 carbohydrate ABC transporter permease [Priestia flexa]RIV10597.1 carbohydrate ABC transporter permease [Priestia flexa]UIR28769.1 carbohydrate ABC transporter permease [Priestia flexa]